MLVNTNRNRQSTIPRAEQQNSTMDPTRQELLSVAKRVSFEIPDHEIEDYQVLHGRMKKALETVAAMEGKLRQKLE